MRKYLALFLVILMAVSIMSAAGVVTAKKEDKPSKLPEYYTIRYGVNQEWKEKQLNSQMTSFDTASTTEVEHTESAVGNTASAAITADPGESGLDAAGVGVQFKLTGVNADNWQTVKTRLVAVTVTVQYDISVDGTSQGFIFPALSLVNSAPAQDTTPIDIVTVNDHHSGTVTKTFTTANEDLVGQVPLTVGHLVPNGDTGDYSGMSIVAVANIIPRDDTMTQHASGSIVVNSISIEYL